MSLKDKKVLVTGSDGFIGSHLVEELVKQGCGVRAFVLYNPFGSRGWIDHILPEIRNSLEIIVGDIRDPWSVKKAVQGCEIIFHLAALIGIPYSYHSPDSYIDVNIRGTLNVLQAARDAGVELVISTSTSEVYGTAQFVPITEEHPLQAQSPYAASKIAADQIALSFYRSFNVPVSIVRPFNTYGARQSLRAVIPTVISQIASGERTIKLGALHPTRDFNYIDDTVNGFIAAARCPRVIGEVVNIGSGYDISIGDVVLRIANLMKVDVSIVRDDQRIRPDKSEVERLLASNEKAKLLLDWKPAFAGSEGLTRGLSNTIQWFANTENKALINNAEYHI